MISIHAPHARSDAILGTARETARISIHAPHARSDDDLVAVQLEIGEFQSTLLMRGATWPGPCKSQRHCISIHAPHARSDCARSGAARCWDISIHAPHARSDITGSKCYICRGVISIHAPHARSDPGNRRQCPAWQGISIHAPHARSDTWTATRRA